MSVVENIFELIGNTPLVKINKLNPNPKVKIYAKLEYFNPTGSLKDRIAKAMIEAAERSGKLTKDKTIVEATSGNTGISLAWVARLKGYNCTLIMPKNVSKEKRKLLEALNAKIILTDTELDAIKLGREMAKDPKYFLTDQFCNEANWEAHYQTTAKEILSQTKGKITHFIAGIGTSGTIMGVARGLKEHNPRIQVIGVMPENTRHEQEGLLNLKDYVPEIYDPKLVDEIITVKDENAFETARRLATEEGIFAGISSGSTMYAAIKIAERLDKGLIVVLFGDSIFRYLEKLFST